MMPAGGAVSRGAQLATLSKLAKSIFVSDKTARLLDAAEAEIANADPDSYRKRAVQQTRSAYEIHKRIPADLVGRIAALGPESEAVWARAKDQNDFAQLQALSQADARAQHRTGGSDRLR